MSRPYPGDLLERDIIYDDNGDEYLNPRISPAELHMNNGERRVHASLLYPAELEAKRNGSLERNGQYNRVSSPGGVVPRQNRVSSPEEVERRISRGSTIEKGGYTRHPSYQEFQHFSRKSGTQHEPGNTQNQQRTNMTQREDVMKFEQGRIKALQEERLHIQKKTFTKWMNSFLQKARMEVDDLFVDLADGKKLLKLLEIISGEKLGRPNNGRMRVHKIENVNKSLAFLLTKVRLESIGAEDIVDGNPRLILGLIWTIILRFQIQEIEIDVDEENESSEKKSAKDALLLWCQRKTNGYHGVHINNFTDSWRSGLGFNALIHSHRPDLFDYNRLVGHTNMDNLNHAFHTAENQLGIPRLLDAEDVDTSRPDEKSVITYVASYYHTFAKMKNEMKIGRRIANIVGQLMDMDNKKSQYSRLVTALLEWIRLKIEELGERDFPNSLDGIQKLLLAFKQYRTVEKPPKYKERSEIEALFFQINLMAKSLSREAFTPAEWQQPAELERAWRRLEAAEHQREVALREELLRQQRLEHLNYKFNTKAVLRKGYLKEMIQVLSDPRYGSNLSQVDATVKKHEAISADIIARTERFEDLTAMAEELVKENYHGAEAVKATERAVLAGWKELLALLKGHQEALSKLSALMALLREVDATLASIAHLRSQLVSEDVGPHLVGVEELAQRLALQELQLGALGETSRKLQRQGAALQAPPQAQHLLTQRLEQLQADYDDLVAAAKERKARLEDARNLYQFIEDHEEEESWVIDRQRICRAAITAKDLRAVLSLQQKHTALRHEMRARERHTAKVTSKGNSLVEEQHPKSVEISRRLESLARLWEQLRELADLRDKQLREAAEAYQFYADANEAESWLKDKLSLAGSADLGSDEPSAQALLSRHKALEGELSAYKTELGSLNAQADRLINQGINWLQLANEQDVPNETENAQPAEEWVNETKLVPTEVWEEEPVERLEHKTVSEERSFPQVKAMYAFSGHGITMTKGEEMLLLNKTNPDWWSVRKADGTDGFVPANYVKEIEPRVIHVKVRRPEKVRTVQRVKKTVLTKQVVKVRVPVTSRPRTTWKTQQKAPQEQGESVDTRRQNINSSYERLLKMANDRHAALEDAIRLYAFYGDCDDLDRWIKDKEKLLRADDPTDSVDTAKRKYEKFVTDMSASRSRLANIHSGVEELAKQKHPQLERARARANQLQRQWDNLNRLREQKEKSLEGASTVELFERTCCEARDWMSEKSRQLEGEELGADLHTVRALQRRHAQLERELAPLQDKVSRVHMLADSVKSAYPSERMNVDKRQQEVQEMWQDCQQKAGERRARLENAVGYQIFNRSSASLLSWLQSVKELLAAEIKAKDVATAEELLKQHQDLLDDINTHRDELNEVIELGEKLVKGNPALSEVAEKVALLKAEKTAVDDEWRKKQALLTQCQQLQSFNREADRIDASSGAHEAFLEFQDLGDSVESVEALVKQHEGFENTLAAQDDRLMRPFYQQADTLAKSNHYATPQILQRKDQVKERRDAVRVLATERRKALQASLAYRHFSAEADDLDAFIQDKMRMATDQSYKDLTNLERKLQKHEAFERELHANEGQLRNVTNTGEALVASEPAKADAVNARLSSLRTRWAALRKAAAERARGLRQAAAQRLHARTAQDAKERLCELKKALETKETGRDLRTCKELLNKHQAVEFEISQWEQRVKELQASGQDMAAEGHFDVDSVQQESKQAAIALEQLRAPALAKRTLLEEGLKFHKFKFSLDAELQWVSERMGAASSEVLGADLHAAQGLHKKHAKLLAEISTHKPGVDKELAKGAELISQKIPDADKIQELCDQLRNAWAKLESAGAARMTRLERSLKVQQFLHDALDVESWLADKGNVLSSAERGRDRDHALQLLTAHKAVELELDTYSAIISEMGHTAQAMASSGSDAAPLMERTGQLAQALATLQKLAAQRQKALVESMCRHEYLTESGELEEWIQEQLAVASSEDYGQDYEHLLILRSKFEELGHRVETGAERFNQCEELAKKLVTPDSPYIGDIENRQEQLAESWHRLVEQMRAREQKLGAAADIHRFHRDAAEALGRIRDKRAQLPDERASPKDLNHALALLRRHEGLENDLVALEAQLQFLAEDAGRLQQLYPGGNAEHIGRQQIALSEGWERLRNAAADHRDRLHAACDLHRFLAQVRDLTSWSSALRAGMAAPLKARDVSAATALKAEHDATKSEIDARDDSFRTVLEMGHAMIQTGHMSAPEVEEKCTSLLEERQHLHSAWQARQVALDQLIDLQFFLRDAKQLLHLCHAQEAALGVSDVSALSSVEEVDTQLKKHEAFERLLNTQEEKVTALNTHGDKLLQQHHPDSNVIADELRRVNERRQKVRELCAAHRDALQNALLHAQFTRDVAETQFWIEDKTKKLEADQSGEVTSLEDKIKKLQKHQAFKAELAANTGRVNELQQKARLLSERKHLAARDVQTAANKLTSAWNELLHKADQRGRGLEEAQDMLEFNNQVDKIETWIRDKEMMVHAADTGKDYEHCSALLRKLDDLDSDMRVDDKHIKSISMLADKLLQQGPTAGGAVAQRRDAFLNKWRALSGALQQYRDNLTAALEIHQYNRDVQETLERTAEKAALLMGGETGKDLKGVERLQRRRDALHRDASALHAKIDTHASEAKKLANKYPSKETAINERLAELQEAWLNLEHLLEQRKQQLDNAHAIHKFDSELKEMEVWVVETVKKLESSEPPNSVPDAEARLELHQERKAEVDNRQKNIQVLSASAKQLPLPVEEDVSIRPKRLSNLSQELQKAWDQKKDHLTQAHQLQLFKEQARQTEDWLAAKEAFLNNDDLGDSLPAVEALIRKHAEFDKLVRAQESRAGELEKFAKGLLDGGHYDQLYIEHRLSQIAKRLDKLKEQSEARAKTLQQSRQLQQFLRDLYHEHEWISLKAQVANDHSYKDLSNLQSKIQRHAAFESELNANQDRIHSVVKNGEDLIHSEHYASTEITSHIDTLVSDWQVLLQATAERRDRLAAAYQARVFLRGLDDFQVWSEDVEAQLQSTDLGKDLASVAALLARHSRLEQEVAQRGEEAAQLRETAEQLVQSKHFMADEIQKRADDALARYRQLQEPMQIRRVNLEEAQQLQRWARDAGEELRWLTERAPLAGAPVQAISLTQAQSLQKKHTALEAELLSREPIVSGLASRAAQMQLRGHFAATRLDQQTQELQETLKSLKEQAAARRLKLQDAVDMHIFLAEAAEAEAWLTERRPQLESSENGRDEDSVQALQRRLEAIQREIITFEKQSTRLEQLASTLAARDADGGTEAVERAGEIRKSLHELTLLGARKQQRLQESDKYFSFLRECEEVNEWISDQMAIAASEDYGTDVEHVEILIQAFDNFVAGFTANEGRVEAVAESGQRLIEERSPESEKIKRHIKDTQRLWNDLRELAHARQEALAGARQVHIFDRTADETIAWIAEKESALSTELGGGHDLHAIQALVKKHDSMEADLEAVKSQVEQLSSEADRLGATFPDAKEHVWVKLEEVSEVLQGLLQRAAQGRQNLKQAGQLQALFDEYGELMAWTSEMLARVTAPELATDLSGAEQLLQRHKEIKTEIDARQDDFTNFYKAGEELAKSEHFLSGELKEKISTLKSRAQQLHETWETRYSIYEQHLDSLIFKRDADILDDWITNREPQLRDGKLGENIPQVEELIKKHEDFQKTIEAQQDRFNMLKRITLVEKAFGEQQGREAAARQAEKERQERERAEERRAAERARIEQQRRMEQTRHHHTQGESINQEQHDRMQNSQSPAGVAVQSSNAQPPVQKSQSSVQAFGDRLRRAATGGVKRAESMKPESVGDIGAGDVGPNTKDVTGKTPKRTPSFTTRRRTQSFRKMQRGDPADLPPVEIQGYLERKHEAGCGGQRAAVRSWREYYTVLCGQLLCFFRDESDFSTAKAAAPPVSILKAECERATDYTKRKHVFRLRCSDGAEFLFACQSGNDLQDWVAKLDFHARLPPSQQLLKYGDAHAIRQKLHNGSSSSSPASSPEPRPRQKTPTQAEILQQHRSSKLSNISSEPASTPPASPRNSAPETSPAKSEPPAIPPRLGIPSSPDSADIVMRRQVEIISNGNRPMSEMNVTSTSPGWGRSRFGSDRDINSEFLTSQKAYQQNSAERGAAESSGESELSLGGAHEKRDKKSRFGGLFSRKKKDRPNTHS